MEQKKQKIKIKIIARRRGIYMHMQALMNVLNRLVHALSVSFLWPHP